MQHDDIKKECKQYEAWLRAIDKHANFDMWFKDIHSRYLFVNKSFENAIGIPKEKLIGRTPTEIFQDEGRAARILAMDKKIIAEGNLKRVVPCDGAGSLRMHEELRFPVEDERGNILGLGCFAIEVSERSFAEEALNQAQSIAKLGSWRWSIKEACLISCSEQFAALLGCTVCEAFNLMHSRLDRVVHPDDRGIVESITNRSSPGDHESYRIEYRLVQPSGQIRHVVEIAEPLFGNDGMPVEYVGTLQDITEQKLVESELREATELLEDRVAERTRHLEYLAKYDELTGLLNRNNYIECIVKKLDTLGSENDLAIIALDLDGFKLVNDTHGHPVGDQVLRIVAQRLKKTVKNTDLLVRLGGDEFAIILFGLNNPQSDATKICGRMRDEICRPISIGNIELRVGCSAGISTCNPRSNGVESIKKAIADADIALYKSKTTTGVHCSLFETQMGRILARRNMLETDLRAALEQDQIRVEYQPQFRMQDQRLSGIESLARWSHPVLGEVSPGEFIPVAEECGLVHQLSKIILRRTCAEVTKLLPHLEPDSNFRIAVNFSPAQFYDNDLLTDITNVLEEFELPANLIEVEVTESLFIKNPENAKSTLDDMKRVGLRIALDDFGTGFSALSYLTRFDFDTIKLDRSFIGTLTEKQAELRLVEGIINLAKNLELAIVAEGVETREQARVLKSLGCDFAQGYYFGRPMPIEQLMYEFAQSSIRQNVMVAS